MEKFSLKVLMTGFDPFGEETRNPSWEAVNLLPEKIEEIDILKMHLPVVYDQCAEVLLAAIEAEKPDAVICVGQAGGRTAVTPELFALNCKEAKSPDNAGNICCGERIVSDGPAAYESTLPVRQMVKAMEEGGVPASLSYCAGTYVCNNLMYHLLHYAARQNPGLKAGFIHIPFDEVQAVSHGGKVAFMPLAMVEKGLEICIGTLKGKNE